MIEASALHQLTSKTAHARLSVFDETTKTRWRYHVYMACLIRETSVRLFRGWLRGTRSQRGGQMANETLSLTVAERADELTKRAVRNYPRTEADAAAFARSEAAWARLNKAHAVRLSAKDE